MPISDTNYQLRCQGLTCSTKHESSGQSQGLDLHRGAEDDLEGWEVVEAFVDENGPQDEGHQDRDGRLCQPGSEELPVIITKLKIAKT